ncbi:hypothetical protein FrEUN1fDRAFT_6594 [Parafrankia sp. EUN1f]|nr:hypothetical protein FrEUN1fDRAFT_6594 [Parafrankia sp. EUN1f]
MAGLVHHNDAGSKQYPSIALTERLTAVGVDASVGSVGDVYDNTLTETVIGLYKNRAGQTPGTMEDRGPGRGRHPGLGRLVRPPPHLHAYGDLPPTNLEAAYRQKHILIKPEHSTA